MTTIEAKGLSKSYGPVKALRDVSFTVEPGEIIGLLGPNGAGKTTLMKILTGYLQPDEGDASVCGIDVLANRIDLQSNIGYLPEHAPLYGDMSVQEYLVTMATLRRVAPEDLRPRISEAVYATGLEPYLTRPIATLSKGYRQRVGIAQAIVHKPEVLILDEPTTGLDPNQIADIRALIRSLAERSTVLLSTHILPEVEMTCERVLIIMQGQLRADSPLDALRTGNSTVVAVDAAAKGVPEALKQLEGAASVERVGGPVTAGGHDDGRRPDGGAPDDKDGGYVTWRVKSDGNDDLARSVFQLVRAKDWDIIELRSETRTLEAVFRDLANQQTFVGESIAGASAASSSASTSTSEVTQ